MKIIRLEGGAFSNREEWHRYLKESFSFPDYYGENLDALADALSEISEDTLIEISDLELWREHLGEYFEAAWETIAEGVEGNPFLRVASEDSFREMRECDD